MRIISRAAILVLLLNAFILQGPARAARFIDLSGNWAERSVNKLSDSGVIQASKDGKFNPEDPVTRAQLAGWIVKALELERKPTSKGSTFPDLPFADPRYESVDIACQYNIMGGFADGFHPDQKMERSALIATLVRSLSGESIGKADVKAELKKFNDAKSLPEWLRGDVAILSRAGILVNHPDPQTIDADKTANRAETAVFIYKLQEYKTRKQIAAATSQAMKAKSGEVPDNTRAQISPMDKIASQLPTQAGDYYGTGSASPSAGAVQTGGGTGAGLSFQPSSLSGMSAAPGTFLRGGVTVVSAGTHFRVVMSNTLDSTYNQAGDEFRATISEPVYANGRQVIPAGAKVIGKVTKVKGGRRFSGSASIDVEFTAIETPDGRRIPISASVDAKRLKRQAGVRGSAAGRTAKTTGRGAWRGMKYGAALGGAYGGARGGTWNSAIKGAGVGALLGTGLGGATGLVGSGFKKGPEVIVRAGMSVPVTLNEPLTLDADLKRSVAQAQPSGFGQGFAQPSPQSKPAPFSGFTQGQPPGAYGQPAYQPPGQPAAQPYQQQPMPGQYQQMGMPGQYQQAPPGYYSQ